jgi:hypothetical protein
LRSNPRAIALSPTRGNFTHFHARAHRGELGLYIYCIHTILFEPAREGRNTRFRLAGGRIRMIRFGL